MIQEEVFDREFVMWIEKELHMEETSHKLACLIQDHKNLKDIIADFFHRLQISICQPKMIWCQSQRTAALN